MTRYTEKNEFLPHYTPQKVMAHSDSEINSLHNVLTLLNGCAKKMLKLKHIVLLIFFIKFDYSIFLSIVLSK